MAKTRYQYARRTLRMRASIIREILKISNKPGIISFAGGLPAAGTFPLKEFEQAVIDTLHDEGAKSLQYMVTEGYKPLKDYLCGWLKKQQIHAKPENMLMVHGSQQGLELIGKIFLNPGDSILVENPSYLGAIQCFNTYEDKYVTVAMDDDGIKPEELKKALAKTNVKFIYVVPTFQNPTGITMTIERRKALLAIAQAKGIPIIEDDPYGLLRFKGKALPSLYSLAGGKGVIYMSTFSKLLSPGIRLGYILAEPEITKRLVLAKQASDLQTNSFIQCAVYHYCKRGHLDKHIPKIIADYKRRAEIMLEAIAKYFPAGVHCVEPDGGMFIWCRMPEKVNAMELFKRSVKKGVAFVDGSVFHANGGGTNTMRLNFTSSTDDQIRAGIEKLGEAIRESL